MQADISYAKNALVSTITALSYSVNHIRKENTYTLESTFVKIPDTDTFRNSGH